MATYNARANSNPMLDQVSNAQSTIFDEVQCPSCIRHLEAVTSALSLRFGQSTVCIRSMETVSLFLN